MAFSRTQTFLTTAAGASLAATLAAPAGALGAPTPAVPLIAPSKAPSDVGAMQTLDDGTVVAAGFRTVGSSFAPYLTLHRTDGSAPVYELGGTASRQPVLAVDGDGNGAVAWPVGDGRIKLRMLHGRKLVGSTQTIDDLGTGNLEPWLSLAVDAKHHRVIVMWRGRTSGGRRRMQWRVSTSWNGDRPRLGSTHTLGEDGGYTQVAADRDGKIVAVWRSGQGAEGQLSWAAKVKGEFTRPTHIPTPSPAVDVELVSVDPDAGTTRDQRWLLTYATKDGGPAFATTRSYFRGFGDPSQVAGTDGASRVSAAMSTSGRSILAVTRRTELSGLPVRAVAAAVSPSTDEAFGSAVDLPGSGSMPDPAPWIEAGAQATIDDSGRATIGWAVQTHDLATDGQPLASATYAAQLQPGVPFQGTTTVHTSDRAAPYVVFTSATPSGLVNLAWTNAGADQLPLLSSLQS